MKGRWLVACALFGFAVACVSIRKPPTPPTSDAPWQATVDAFDALRHGLVVPAHLQEDTPVKAADDFDANRYFSVLEHLAMEPGYVLDYVYYFDGMGGRPILYARPEAQDPYATYEDYAGAVVGQVDTLAYLAHVQADGTPESYFELALLQTMGSQFYLYWHASYNDWRVVCSREAAETLITSLTTGFDMPTKDANAALRLDFTPRVEVTGNTATVRIVTFTKWGGFYEETYVYQRSFPHALVSEDSKELIPYDCGIMF